jgi:hypothetical protein
MYLSDTLKTFVPHNFVDTFFAFIIDAIVQVNTIYGHFYVEMGIFPPNWTWK